jgi:type VI secretion system secreted protein VgrG
MFGSDISSSLGLGMDYSQDNRLLSIETPLGKDVMLLTRLDGEEALSNLFEINIEMFSQRKAIDPSELVGQNVTLQINDAADGFLERLITEPRYINGYIRYFRQEGRQLQDLRSYTAVVVPWLWFLTQTSDCKVFQNQTVEEIATSIFLDNGFSDFQFRCVMPKNTREYTVQYKESDFDFLSRLFEEEGFYYYFQHEHGKHTLIISDHIGGYGKCKDGQVEYSSGSLVAAHTIHTWHHTYQFMTGQCTQRDYDFTQPRNRLNTCTAAQMKVPGVQKFERFTYPGRYTDKALGERYTRYRMEAEEAEHDVIIGESGCRSFVAGHSFTLSRHDDDPAEKGDYLLMSVVHTAQDYSFTIDDEQIKEYSNHFRCMDSDTIYRPPLKTGWPKMQGPQNAIVVGPAGEEIYTDEYGRVKIQFPWDRYGQYDENSSCWVRVSHAWAGKGWGGIYIPRVGQEVIVDFIDGNPDNPLITGRVYNADQMPPFGLPANKTQSGFLSRSSKGAGASNANALRFEDKKGEEEIWLHAERNQRIEVENDESHWVGRDRQKRIDGNETVEVKLSKTTSIGENEGVSVGKSRTTDIGETEQINVKENMRVHVGKHMEFICGSSRIVMTENSIHLESPNIHIQAPQYVHIDGNSEINLNSGTSSSGKSGPAVKAHPKITFDPSA